jgi:SNF2 family DNA or RNA helicase
MVLLTATPVQRGSEDLFHLLQILDPKEFSSPIAFDRRARENAPIVQAERLVRTRNQENLNKALQLLLQYKGNRQDLRPTETILLDRVISRLGEIDGSEAATIVALQRDLNRLNSFAHIVTRTRKREVTERAPERKANTIEFEWSTAEANVYRLVTDYVIRRQRGGNWGAFAIFATMMPQRQVASCIQAMLEYYRDRINWTDPQIDLNPDDDEEVDEETADKTMRRVQEEFYAEIRGLLKQPIPDTKFDKLLEVLHGLDEEQPGEKIVIFSYFKKTLEYLSQRLQKKGYSNTVISGDYDGEERRKRIASFSQPDGPRILLSSEVGSEGLDMQFCHIMINYDLPWNPMVVEQRIGRLDRHGQRAERIHRTKNS